MCRTAYQLPRITNEYRTQVRCLTFACRFCGKQEPES